jgi:hypothetical protein
LGKNRIIWEKIGLFGKNRIIWEKNQIIWEKIGLFGKKSDYLGNIRFFGKKTDFFPNNFFGKIFWEKLDFLGKNPIFRLCNNFFFKCLPPRGKTLEKKIYRAIENPILVMWGNYFQKSLRKNDEK